MKKFLSIIAAVSAIALFARADSYTYTATLTNTQPVTISDVLPVSGELDRIEAVTDTASARPWLPPHVSGHSLQS